MATIASQTAAKMRLWGVVVAEIGDSNSNLLFQEKITLKQKDGLSLLNPVAFCLLVQSKWPDSHFIWKLFLRQWLNIKSQAAKYHTAWKTPRISFLWRMFLLVLVFASFFSWTDDCKKRIMCAESNSKDNYYHKVDASYL